MPANLKAELVEISVVVETRISQRNEENCCTTERPHPRKKEGGCRSAPCKNQEESRELHCLDSREARWAEQGIDLPR